VGVGRNERTSWIPALLWNRLRVVLELKISLQELLTEVEQEAGR
jgi:hypothetical protein